MRTRLGERDAAVAAFREALAADPADRNGAALHLARLGAGDPAAAMSPGYVRALFDQYAPRFDDALGEPRLSAPSLLRESVEAVCDGAMPRFGSMLDLGCGTGLAGVRFRPHVDWLVGIDLAPKMVEEARRKGVYDKLAVGDVAEFLGEQEEGAFHLVVAADVVRYLADLSAVCPRPRACWRRRACSPSRSRRMRERRSFLARRCATPTAGHTSARPSRAPG